jgi:RNA polymerase sigma-70 factor (ECF subfamily)
MITLQQKTRQQVVLTMAHHDYQKGLNSHAFFKIHDHAMGEDMVQDTFVKTWVYLAKGGKIQTMKAFLYHILNNLIIDEYRKQKYQTTSLDVLLEKGFEPGVSDTDRLIDFLDGKGALVLIARLPIAYQKIMRMRYVQDLSYKEMALIMGTSKNNMAVQVHRGLQKLKLLYKPA